MEHLVSRDLSEEERRIGSASPFWALAGGHFSAIIGNLMVTYSEDQLDRIFGALADRTRRALLRTIGEAPRSVKELAAPFEMSRPAVSKHLKVLETAGLIRRDRDGRFHRSRPRRGGFRAATRWLAEVEIFWESQLDRFQELVESSPTKNEEN